MMTMSTTQISAGEGQNLAMDNANHVGLNERASNFVNSITNAASPQFTEGLPFSKHTDPSQSHTVASPQHQFNMDNFDFGADFGLPTTLDEMTLFHQHQQQNQQSPENIQQQQQRFQEQQSHKRAGSSGGRSVRGPPSSDGMANSPHNVSFSPGSSIRDHQRLQSGMASRTQSPHPLSMGTANDPGHVTGPPISNADLQNLLMAVQSSSTNMAPQHLRSQHMSTMGTNSSDGSGHGAIGASSALGQMSFSDIERYLADKEQTEKMQIMQTALLRQQLESLQRQQSQMTTNQSTDSRLNNLTAAQLMQQFKQMSPQQEASTPTQQHPRIPSFSSQSQHFADSMNLAALAATTQHPHKPSNPSSLTQYGLATPISSGAFAHQGAPPFVSPIHMPPGSHAALIEHQRAYDAMTNGTFTPLESPAVTPASVFSNMGASHSTAPTSQDIFSPLTSPALRPQIGQPHDELMLPPASPYYGPMLTRGRTRNGSKSSPHIHPTGKRTTTPSASPITAPTKSIPRKNRSTTAEARANRARPSPLVKPTAAVTGSTTTSRKRTDSSATNGMPSPLGVTYTNGNNLVRNASSTSSESRKGRSTSSTTFPPLSASAAITKSMGASPSEGAASTPSPIDLNTSVQASSTGTGKPMTPGSVMGIHATRRAKAKSIDNGSKQVSFAGQSQGDEPDQVSMNMADGSAESIMSQVAETSSGGGDPWMATTNRSSGGIESRRTSHKAAEQKRRDSLKYCFDELRGMLPAITLDDDAPGGSSLGPDGFLEDQEEEDFTMEEVGDAESARLANRAISKVALLRHSNEYLIRLKGRLARRDRDLDYCRRQVLELRSRLGYPMESQMGGVMVDFTTMNNNNIVRQSQEFIPNAMNHMDVS